MNGHPAPGRWALPGLFGTYFMIALAMSVVVPLGEASDEVSHWSYVQYLTEFRQLPQPNGAVLGESRQPPLYYLVAAALTAWVPREPFPIIANPDFSPADDQAPNLLLHLRREQFPFEGAVLAWHLVRVLSILMGAVTVWGTWHIALEFLPREKWIAFGSAAFVSLLPGFLSVSSQINNDNLVIMLTTLGILQVLRIAHGMDGVRHGAVLGLLMGLAVLAKWSGLTLWILVPAALFIAAFQKRAWDRVMRPGGVAFGLALLIIAPWVLDNMLKYGDPLGWSLALSVTDLRSAPLNRADLRILVEGLYTSFWGRFGGILLLKMHPAVYIGLGVVQVGSLLGWMGFARDGLRRRACPGIFFLLSVVFAFTGIVAASFIRWSQTFAGTEQARLVYPGLPLWAVVTVVGWTRLFMGVQKRAMLAGAGALVVLDLCVLGFLHSTYYPLPASPVGEPRAPGGLTSKDFATSIRILDQVVSTGQVAPDGEVSVTITWQALDDLKDDLWLMLKLENGAGAVAQKEGVPSAGRVTTDWWKRGEVYSSRHTLRVPAGTAPGVYHLRLGLHPFGRWEWLLVDDQDTLDLGRVVVQR